MPYRGVGLYKVPGVGCACGDGCHCGGMGQASSLSQVGNDFSALLGDLFLNADGSLNWTAVGFAGVAGILIFVNWGNTTRKRR